MIQTSSYCKSFCEHPGLRKICFDKNYIIYSVKIKMRSIFVSIKNYFHSMFNRYVCYLDGFCMNRI